MASAIEQSGGQLDKPTPFGTIWTNRFITGRYTNRNPLRDAATPYLYEKFYSGSRYESLIDGLNCELTPKLTLRRSYGTSVYNSATFPAINGFYEFRTFDQSGNETIKVIADSDPTVYDATGPSTQTTILSKAPQAGQTIFQSFGNVLYMANGVDADKYIQVMGAWTTQLWGISIGSQSSTVTGPAGTGADVTVAGGVVWSNPSGVTGSGAKASVTLNPAGGSPTSVAKGPTAASQSGAGNAWSSLNNIFTQNGQDAVTTLANGDTSEALRGSNYKFAIPGNAVILGIEVVIWRQAVPLGGTATVAGNVQLVKNGSAAGTSKADGTWPATNTAHTLGTSSDLWGTTWTPAQINSSSFGAQVIANRSAGTAASAAAEVDYIGITVFYTIPAGPLVSDLLQASNYSFSVPAGNQIQGIQVEINGSRSGAGGSLQIKLLVNGSPVGTAKLNVQLPASTGNIFLGSSSDLWGVPGLNPTQTDATNFGISIQAVNSSTTTETWNVGAVTITVFNQGAPVVTSSGSGSYALTDVDFAYAYGNSASGHVSDATQRSNILTFTGKAQVNIPVVASTDPQVDQIWVFRTLQSDSGGSLLALPGSPYPNATATIVSSDSDASLIEELVAPEDEANAPPPAGLTNVVQHLGRIWGSVGNILYYSQSSVTMGVPQESWPPNNFYELSGQIIRMKPTAVGLLIFTTSDVWLLPIISTDPFFSAPYVFIEGLGLLSYNALWVNGTIIYMMTSAREVISLDPNAGIGWIGDPIGDVFDTAFDPSQAYVTMHIDGIDRGLYIGDGLQGWERMSMTIAPEVGQPWSTRRNITNGCSAIQSVEVIPGTKRLLIGPSASGAILQRDTSTNTDNGTPYPVYATVGSLVLAQPGGIALLDFLAADLMPQGSLPTLAVLLDEISGAFEPLSDPIPDPPDEFASTSLYSYRWYMDTIQDSCACRHFQLMFSWPAEDAANELLTFAIFAREFREL